MHFDFKDTFHAANGSNFHKLQRHKEMKHFYHNVFRCFNCLRFNIIWIEFGLSDANILLLSILLLQELVKKNTFYDKCEA